MMLSTSANTASQANQAPTSEALYLSASIFTQNINSWIPTSFAPPRTQAQLDQQFRKTLESASRAGQDDRLGLGHERSDQARVPGLGALGRRLNGLNKGKGRGKDLEDRITVEGDLGTGSKDQEEEDEDGEESRVKAVVKGKKRNIAFDPLATKKKSKANAPPKENPLVTQKIAPATITVDPTLPSPDKASPPGTTTSQDSRSQDTDTESNVPENTLQSEEHAVTANSTAQSIATQPAPSTIVHNDEDLRDDILHLTPVAAESESSKLYGLDPPRRAASQLKTKNQKRKERRRAKANKQ